MTDLNYLRSEIRELATFPGIDTAAVTAELTTAGGDARKVEAIYDRLMESCYGGDY